MAESASVTWSWQPAGWVTLGEGALIFPRVPNKPGVYRLTFFDAAGAPAGVYIGEADPLLRRFRRYRTPGSSARPRAGSTNVRMNSIMIDTLGQGGQIHVEIVTAAKTAGEDGVYRPLDLSWKAARVLIEQAATINERAAASRLLNL